MRLLHFCVLLAVLITIVLSKTVFRSETQQLTNNSRLIEIIEDIQLTRELLKGRDGRDGVTGRDGLPGPPGAPGRDGLDGTNGQKGDKGERGDSNGVVGPQGPPGLDGTNGQKGDKGVRGDPGVVGPSGPVRGGATYIRWGRTSCPSITGTSLVYNGRAAKSYLNQKGGGVDYQCLPNNPEYGGYAPGVQGHSPIYGVEYDLFGGSPFPSALYNDNVPCAVCHVSTRSAVLMIPAWRHCPSGWTVEYTGYLMSERYVHSKATYECVDSSPQSVPGSQANTDGGSFYHVEATCNGLPCPPYDTQKELTCAVCTK